jgi:hypothetical protein
VNVLPSKGLSLFGQGQLSVQNKKSMQGWYSGKGVVVSRDAAMGRALSTQMTVTMVAIH